MLIIDQLSYIHSDKETLFHNLQFSLSTGKKAAIIGNNGAGKSTLLKLIAGQQNPNAGRINVAEKPYYLPQLFDAFHDMTVAQALGIAQKLSAFHAILEGDATDENLLLLDDDWTLEERCAEAFARWEIQHIQLDQAMATLSGGQKSKVFLAGITIHQAKFVLMDEPSNHLDTAGRQLLYDFIQHSPLTLLVVSHDRTLLNLLDTMYELSKVGIKTYGGNYDFYAEQKGIAEGALHDHIHAQEKELRKAREKERQVNERQQKLDNRGSKKQLKAGVSRIMMNTLRNQAEQSSAKNKQVHQDKIGTISKELTELRGQRPEIDKMKFDFATTTLHQGKVLFSLQAVNYSYGSESLWSENHSLQINSGERIALAGGNGSGKTTLIQLLLGQLSPSTGVITKAAIQSVYIDQDYSLLENQLSVYEQAEYFNNGSLAEHDIKIRLDRFLFSKETWTKRCDALSGGERMRLALCCLTISSQAPDLIVLDEPTNNLDLQNIGILTSALQQYQGTLLVVSHDATFLAEIGINRWIKL